MISGRSFEACQNRKCNTLHKTAIARLAWSNNWWWENIQKLHLWGVREKYLLLCLFIFILYILLPTSSLNYTGNFATSLLILSQVLYFIRRDNWQKRNFSCLNSRVTMLIENELIVWGTHPLRILQNCGLGWHTSPTTHIHTSLNNLQFCFPKRKVMIPTRTRVFENLHPQPEFDFQPYDGKLRLYWLSCLP